MDDPIKIIHKYKNNNRRIQYHIQIFIGDLLDEQTMRVLKKIKDMDLYASLTELSEKERNLLIKKYGAFWYEKFFNSHHIIFTKENTKKNSAKMKELKDIYGDEWVKEHFRDYQKKFETITYSYAEMVKEERERKMIRKIQRQQTEADEFTDYTTKERPPGETARVKSWCDDESSSEEEESDSEDYDRVFGGQNPRDEKTPDIEGEVFADQVAPDEFDFTDIEYRDEISDFEAEVEEDLENADIVFADLEEPDKDVKQTTKDIKDAISNQLFKSYQQIESFDTNKDNNVFDENLKDVYHKHYIVNQYIYKDDTIKTIRNKICDGFKNNDKFGDNTYILPSYQYLWTEYRLGDKVEKVMIGQKWIIRNDILKLDVEPNDNLGVYEDLRGNLKSLRDAIRRHGKIKREDDENNIFYDYDGYYTYNEIMMVDIYNEFGLNYDPNFEEKKNVADVFMRIYFPYIQPDDFTNILNYLNTKIPESKKVVEKNKMAAMFSTISNDLILENEIMKDVELVKIEHAKEYKKIFQENYVTQSVIRAYLIDRNKRIDLFRIFDNFALDEKYPFIQYRPIDGVPRYRYNEKYLMENEKKEIVMKWFENSPYGISFKVKVDDRSDFKYMAINLGDNGRIDYKIQWKEEDMSTVDDIKGTYIYIRELIKKINNENEKFHIKLAVPRDDNFKFAFINTIQRFVLPEKFVIEHNDLSEFSRYFFPYIALVIEPRKRQAKVKKGEKEEKSKFGTYLRYRRVSKYENRTKIEHRIIFFMRNYEYNDQSLVNEISKEFNITEEQAMIEIKNVREKYPNIKKSRKILKKMENIPKYKPPGIGIDIQGKTREKYKMRIAGARDREQLDRIIDFMNILIYLYAETYLYKKPERQRMKDRLKRLTKIAKRRNKVEEIVNYETPSKNVKQMTAIDKKRLSYRADEDQNQWTRNCQNSGDDKKRRPQQFLHADELIRLGYTWKEKLDGQNFGHFERKVLVDTGGKKKKEVILRAVQLSLDDTGENFVYYVCGPEENGKHMYIGFLSRSKNPYGEAMPCCFIKDHLYSKNKEKRNFYMKSVGLIPDEEQEPDKITGEQLYILRDSNRLGEGRFSLLPKYLDIFLNYMMGNEHDIKNNYLISTKTGYYYKYGAKQDEYRYLNALCATLDITIDDAKNKMIAALESDKKNLSIFTSLNNGEIRLQFRDIDAYISYLKNNDYLEYPLINDLFCLPGVIKKNGLNIIIFKRKIRVIKKSLEKEKTKEYYYAICHNQENIDNIKDPNRETIFVIKQNRNYFPIVKVIKEDESSKDISTVKTFIYSDAAKNPVNQIMKYYKINCRNEYAVLVNNKLNSGSIAKETYRILLDTKKKDYFPKAQIVDARFRCKYFVTTGGYIVPTLSSGAIYNLRIIDKLDNYIKDFKTTSNYLNDVYKITNQIIKTKPIGVYYKEKKEKKYLVTSIMTESYDSIPITYQMMDITNLKKEKLIVQGKPDDDIIDKEIQKGPKNFVLDERIYEVSKANYEAEMYQLFRFHLSYYLNYVKTGLKHKEHLEKLINHQKLGKKEIKLEIKKLLYQISNSELSKTFNELLRRIKQQGGVSEVQVIPGDYIPGTHMDEPNPNTEKDPRFDFTKTADPPNTAYQFFRNEPPQMEQYLPEDEKTWINIFPETRQIDYPKYKIENHRQLCYEHQNKDACGNIQNCKWSSSKNTCVFSCRQDYLVEFINKVTEELVQNELKAHEILRKGNYFVSDIVDYNVFTERPGEKIIISSSVNLPKVLGEIFGKESVPLIGKRRNKLDTLPNYEQMNYDNPMMNVGNWYLQKIIDNNNTIFRAFANSYFWLMHPFNDIAYRNIGYYSEIQTNLSNIYKSQVIDWLSDSDNDFKPLFDYTKYKKIKDLAMKLSTDVYTLTNGIIELFVLSKIYDTVIYVYNDSYNIIYVIHPYDGIVYDFRKQNKPFNTSTYAKFKKNIYLKFIYISKNIYPDRIEAMYSKQ